MHPTAVLTRALADPCTHPRGDRMAFVINRRILQLMPADGWWAVVHDAEGTATRRRPIAFALVEEWGAAGRERAPVNPADADRRVIPLVWQDGAVAVVDAVNLIAVAYDDEIDDAMRALPRRRATDRSLASGGR